MSDYEIVINHRSPLTREQGKGHFLFREQSLPLRPLFQFAEQKEFESHWDLGFQVAYLDR